MNRLTIYFTVVLATFAIGVVSTAIYFLLPINKPFETNQNLQSKLELKTVLQPDLRQIPTDADDLCKETSERVEKTLAESYNEYQIIKRHPSVEKLVALDIKLRKLRVDDKVVECDKNYKLQVALPDKYKEIGFEFGWSTFKSEMSDRLWHSNKLLIEAHKINPHSKYRKYTLYSTIFGKIDFDRDLMPNVEAAYDYEREFPHGPFIKETLYTIAGFNKDLYLFNNARPELVFVCYKPYLNKSSHSSRAEKARQKAIVYYQKLLKFGPSDYEVQKVFLKDLQKKRVELNGSVSFCLNDLPPSD